MTESDWQKIAADLIDGPEAAKIAKISTERLYVLCREGRVPHIKPGQSYVFSRSLVRDWAKKLRKPGRPRSESP